MVALQLVSSNEVPAPLKAPVLSLELDGMRFGDTEVLGPCSLTLRQGETVALTGPSGVGKTTLIRIAAGLEPRYRGRVNAPDRIAMVFQEPTLMPWRNLRDNLLIPLGISADEAEASLAEVGLGGRGDAFPRQLSLGQQRRMALARAFASKPQLLLMDEPFVSLDAELADEMMGLFETLRSRRAVTTLIVTHAADEARRLATRILRLEGQPARLRDINGK